jgi:hypothetical protein
LNLLALIGRRLPTLDLPFLGVADQPRSKDNTFEATLPCAVSADPMATASACPPDIQWDHKRRCDRVDDRQILERAFLLSEDHVPDVEVRGRDRVVLSACDREQAGVARLGGWHGPGEPDNRGTTTFNLRDRPVGSNLLPWGICGEHIVREVGPEARREIGEPECGACEEDFHIDIARRLDASIMNLNVDTHRLCSLGIFMGEAGGVDPMVIFKKDEVDIIKIGHLIGW